MKKNETNEEVIYSLIIDDLDETISDEDKLVLKHWRGASDVNEKIYQEFIDIHINISKLFEERGYDTQTSWEVLDKKIGWNQKSEFAIHNPVKKSRYWIGIAASILFLFSIGYYAMFSNNYETISTDKTGTHVFLPDSTSINLNSGTVIRYNKSEFRTNRKLELLTGEIFIKVNHRNGSQFKVDLGEIEALDIGTSFNIIKTDKNINVVVEEGKVALMQNAFKKQILLTPGKLGLYDHETKSLIAADNLDVNYKAWFNKEFVFTETPLSDVLNQLSKVYGEPIRIKGADLKERKLTARLHYQTLDSAIAVIAASLDCRSVKSKNTYVISEN